MWGYVAHKFSRQGEVCKDKIVLGKMLRSVSLHGVGLCAVLATFGFSKNLIVDSAQCHPAQSPTPRSVGQFWIFEKYSIFFEISSYGSINYLELEIFENLKNLFDSAQC